jgi:hypothetical protein
MYDPNCEETNEETVIAAHWECLRRNSEFRSLSERWLKSENFRHSYALTSDYHDLQHHTSRCALDWMLTTTQRVRLAKFQIENRKWIFDCRFNFGPLVCHENFPPVAVTRENWRKFYRVEPMPDPPPPIHVDQPWNKTADLFKEKFRIAYSSDYHFGEINPGLNSVADFLRNAGIRLARDSVKESPIIAPLLFKLGSELRDLAEFCKAYAIPKRRHSEKQFKSFLEQIRENFNASVPLIPTKTYDAHKSYLGTIEDWRWFLKAESMGLDVRKAADLRTLSERYSEDLRERAIRGKAPRRAKAHGFTGSKIPGKVIKNRRRTVKRHVLTIESWIRRTYPPQPTSAPAKAP